jgi:hypothetical protein
MTKWSKMMLVNAKSYHNQFIDGLRHYSKGLNLPYCKVFQIQFATENENSIFVPVKL